MKYGVYAPIFNDYGSPARLVELAVTAEAAGYDGFFIWDHLAIEPGGQLAVVDATVILGAIAQATQRIRLGALITPLARRRPWKFAKELVTLDHLSDGRVIAGVGLGEPAEVEFTAFGEDGSGRVRAARLDEGLAILEPLLRGEHVDHAGPYYTIRHARLAPAPVQVPRMPIWVAATLPAKAGVRRAARWDGVVPVRLPRRRKAEVAGATDWSEWWLDAAEFATLVNDVEALRTTTVPFDFVASGRVAHCTEAAALALVAGYAEAGATWWLEWVDEAPGTADATLAAIRRGPPTVA